MRKPGLLALLDPHSEEKFLEHYRANEPMVVSGLGSTIRPLLELPFLKSLEALLGFWPNPVQAHLPKIADEASAIDVSTSDARKLFDNGMGLLFDHADRLSPVLKEWL